MVASLSQEKPALASCHWCMFQPLRSKLGSDTLDQDVPYRKDPLDLRGKSDRPHRSHETWKTLSMRCVGMALLG